MIVALITSAVAASVPGASSEAGSGWARQPDMADLARAYPARALKSNLDGRANLDCFVSPDGLLVNCKAVDVTPPGYGFGTAALDLSRAFRAPPRRDGGQTAVGPVRIPVIFRIADLPAHGHVVLQCLAKGDGGVEACGVVRETPAYAGYDVAALRQAAGARLTGEQAGAAPGSSVRLSFAYEGPPPPSPRPAEGPRRSLADGLKLAGLFFLGAVGLVLAVIGCALLQLWAMPDPLESWEDTWLRRWGFRHPFDRRL